MFSTFNLYNEFHDDGLEIAVGEIPNVKCVNVMFKGKPAVNQTDTNDVEQTRPSHRYMLTKSQARGIASAIMGCASEL